jgi:hypothetical protein
MRRPSSEGFSAMPRAAAVALISLSTLALAGAAAAKDVKVSEGRAAAFKAVTDCRAMSDPTARLACYDDAVSKLDQAEASGQVVVLDRAAAKEVKRQAFGFSIPSISLFSKGDKEEEVDRLTDTLKSARERADHRWVFTLSDGQVWRQIDTSQFVNDPKAGDSVEIKRAALGSYVLKVDGKQPAVKVHRDD